MNAHTKFPKSLGLHEEALRDAEEAGVCRSDVATLIEIGEAFADFSRRIAPMLMSMTDGRLATIYPDKGGVVHQCANFSATNLMALMMEAAVENLDHYAVITSAADIRAMRASELERQIRGCPTDRVALLVQREAGA